jgi:hypothetical protein
MSEKKTHATAIVTLTVEVHLRDMWGPGAMLGQVYEQAARAAVEMLGRVLVSATKDPSVNRVPDVARIRIVGEPEVRQVIASEIRS